MKFLGSTDKLAQLPRIIEAYNELGIVLNDTIYCNDGGYYDEAIRLKHTDYSQKLILNVLDIPEHLFPQYDIEALTDKLLEADVVTCISQTVQAQIRKYCGIEAKIIYNPIKNVSYRKSRRNNKYLYVGRANDPNKRFKLIRAQVDEEDLTVCGPENPGFGNYLGIVSDEELNELYNTTRFLLLPSRFEGIGLTACEASLCGCIPILSQDNKAASEFFPPEFIHRDYFIPGIMSTYEMMENDYREFLITENSKIIRNKLSATNVIKRIIKL